LTTGTPNPAMADLSYVCRKTKRIKCRANKISITHFQQCDDGKTAHFTMRTIDYSAGEVLQAQRLATGRIAKKTAFYTKKVHAYRNYAPFFLDVSAIMMKMTYTCRHKNVSAVCYA
jgi:hypothetical protein